MDKHKISDCCGASPVHVVMEEMEICSECGDHCEYIKAEEYEGESIFNVDDRGDNAWFHDPDMGARG